MPADLHTHARTHTHTHSLTHTHTHARTHAHTITIICSMPYSILAQIYIIHVLTLRIRVYTAHVYTHFTHPYAPYMHAHATHQRALYTNACACAFVRYRWHEVCNASYEYERREKTNEIVLGLTQSDVRSSCLFFLLDDPLSILLSLVPSTE